jgi:mannose-6-phosphate isomerase-like protein (cupin superfamily)
MSGSPGTIEVLGSCVDRVGGDRRGPRVTVETVTTTFDDVATFTMLGTPLLSEGQSQTLIALAPQLWLHAKVYARGGERVLHAHPNEDHAFFLLQGRATFETERGEPFEVGPYEGVMIPRGVRYAFECVGDDALVILRIGSGEQNQKMADGRVAATMPTVGRPDEGRHHVEIPGAFFTGNAAR